MIVSANIRQTVEIDPLEVIQNLIKNEIGTGWVLTREEKHYSVYERSAGPHTIEVEQEIEVDKYEYVTALQLIQQRLSNKQKNKA